MLLVYKYASCSLSILEIISNILRRALSQHKKLAKSIGMTSRNILCKVKLNLSSSYRDLKLLTDGSYLSTLYYRYMKS